MAWTSNGMYEAALMIVSPDPDGKRIQLAGVSKRCSRVMKCGFKIAAEDMDSLCVRWLEVRGIREIGMPSAAGNVREAMKACEMALQCLGENPKSS